MEPVPEGVLIFSEDISKRKKPKSHSLEAMEKLKNTKDEISLEKLPTKPY